MLRIDTVNLGPPSTNVVYRNVTVVTTYIFWVIYLVVNGLQEILKVIENKNVNKVMSESSSLLSYEMLKSLDRLFFPSTSHISKFCL